MTVVVRCDACGGGVVYDARAEVAACLFCASVALHPDDGSEARSAPQGMLSFEIDPTEADLKFRGWASGSWWYAEPVRRAAIALHQVLVPVWEIDAKLETHWAGLVKARNRSGAKPRAGVDHARMRTMVPASLGLAQGELEALAPYGSREAAAFDPSVPHEVPVLSEKAAFEVAREQLLAEHRDKISRAQKLRRCRANAIMRRVDTRLLMVPVYIGSFRFREQAWRFVINGQTGAVAGKAPLDRRKIALVVGLAAVALLLWLWLRG